MASNKPIEGDEGIAQKPLFKVDMKLLHNTRRPENYTNDPSPM